MAAASGSNPNPEKDPPSTSLSQPELSSRSRPQVLVVEDSKADAVLIRQAMKTASLEADAHFVEDGHKAMQFFDTADSDSSAPCPDLVLLDLNLPKKSGVEVLAHLRNSRTCNRAAVLIVTSSDSIRDREAVAALGATDYFRKPSTYPDFLKLGAIMKDLLERERRSGDK